MRRHFTMSVFFINSLDEQAFVFIVSCRWATVRWETLVFCSLKISEKASDLLFNYYSWFTEPADWSLLSPVECKMRQTCCTFTLLQLFRLFLYRFTFKKRFYQSEKLKWEKVSKRQKLFTLLVFYTVQVILRFEYKRMNNPLASMLSSFGYNFCTFEDMCLSQVSTKKTLRFTQ